MRNEDRRVIAQKFTGRGCTLDDEPAVIIGFRGLFATVIHTRPGGRQIKCSWPTVEKVMTDDKCFVKEKHIRAQISNFN